MPDGKQTRASKQPQSPPRQKQPAAHSPVRREDATDPAALMLAAENPRAGTPAAILQLQGMYGNRAVGRMIARAAQGRPAGRLRRKMEVGAPDDSYEQEADRVSRLVMGRLSESAEQAAARKGGVGGSIRSGLQRAGSGGGPVDTVVESSIEAARAGGQPLPKGLRASMEQAFEADFSGVSVHADAQSDSLSRAVQARAFTTGKDIFFRQGEFNPSSSAGQGLIAHELTHVVQQGAAGRLRRKPVEVTAAPRNSVQLKWGESFAQGKARHDADRAALDKAIQAGLAQKDDTRLRNSCEWVMQGDVGKRIYAMTKTHDSYTRARKQKQPLGNIALFPNPGSGDDYLYAGGALKTPPKYYDKDKSSVRNIYWEDEGIFGRTEGLQFSQGVAVINAAKKGQAAVWEILRHEVQHAADLHGHSDIERYKTEYRAYSMEGKNYGSATKKVKRRGYTWTERQYKIFSHIYSGYDHTKNGWNQNPKVPSGKTFREEVVAFDLPVSLNPQNSIRVDAFVKALQKLVPAYFTTDLTKSPAAQKRRSDAVKELTNALLALKPDEKRMILDNKAIDLRKHLSPRVATQYELFLKGGASAKAPTFAEMYG